MENVRRQIKKGQPLRLARRSRNCSLGSKLVKYPSDPEPRSSHDGFTNGLLRALSGASFHQFNAGSSFGTFTFFSLLPLSHWQFSHYHSAIGLVAFSFPSGFHLCFPLTLRVIRSRLVVGNCDFRQRSCTSRSATAGSKTLTTGFGIPRNLSFLGTSDWA
jgi:hypothetical protein